MFVRVMMAEQGRVSGPPVTLSSAALDWRQPWHWGLEADDWVKMYWLATGGTARIDGSDENDREFMFGKWHLAMTLSWCGRPALLTPPLRTAVNEIFQHLRQHTPGYVCRSGSGCSDCQWP
jgi:hypothetical protein